MPMFIYHYMILNIIVNGPAGRGRMLFFPILIDVTICYGYRAGRGFFPSGKPFWMRPRLMKWEAKGDDGFFSQNWEESRWEIRCRNGMPAQRGALGKEREKAGEGT